MTYTPIVEKEKIRIAYETLKDAFQQDGVKIKDVCGHPAWLHEDINLYGAFGEVKKENYWIGFGHEGEEKPVFGANIKMEGKGSDGLFVEDKGSREIHLTHSGDLHLAQREKYRDHPATRNCADNLRKYTEKFAVQVSWVSVEGKNRLKVTPPIGGPPGAVLHEVAQVHKVIRRFMDNPEDLMSLNSPTEDLPQPETYCALNTILYGPPGTGKTFATARRCVEICEGPLDNLQDDEIRRRYNRLVENRRVEFITFHQSYSYEEFVEGLRPEVNETPKSSAGFRLVPAPGILKQIADRARFSLAGRQIFKMSLGPSREDKKYEKIFKQSMESGYACLGHGGNVDWSDPKFDSNYEIGRYWEEEKLEQGMGKDFLQKFRNAAKEGDILIVPAKPNKFRAIGEITGSYEYSPDGEYHHRRAVRWHWSDESGRSSTEIHSKPTHLAHSHAIRLLEQKLVIREKLLDYICGPYVLIIDEINRANISKVMGELITLLEEDKREGAENEVVVRLPYSREPFTLPANLHILGTMNTADRSIALIDTALRRRFQFEELAPDPDQLKEDVDGIKLRDVLRAINNRLEYLIDRDHLIGHAWLMQAETKADVDSIMRHKIIPLIAEYFYDDWRKVNAVLGDTDDFIQREKLRRPPGLEEAEADEDRYRWAVQKEEFSLKAYSRLIEGKEGKHSGDGSED